MSDRIDPEVAAEQAYVTAAYVRLEAMRAARAEQSEHRDQGARAHHEARFDAVEQPSRDWCRDANRERQPAGYPGDPRMAPAESLEQRGQKDRRGVIATTPKKEQREEEG